MDKVIMYMPKMGEGVLEVEVVQWLKKKGERIDEDEELLEVSTDKVDTDILSEYSGYIDEIFADSGKKIGVGEPLVSIKLKESKEKRKENPTTTPKSSQTLKKQILASKEKSGKKKEKQEYFFLSPLVKSIVKNEGISLEELNNITGTGVNNRITKDDIIYYISDRKKKKDTEREQVKVIPMDHVRKEISRRMVYSRETAVHVTAFIEARASNIVKWRNKYKEIFFAKFGTKLTYTPLFLYIIASLLKKYPLLNASIEKENIILKNNINTGFAIALPTGNLIVPVIKNADKLTFTEMTIKVQDLIKKAKANQLKREEVTDGTYTLSNIGTFGNLMGTPIILQPQVATLAVGAIVKKPVVIESPVGDTIGIQDTVFLSHSFDHRLIDGMMGGIFIKEIAEALNTFDLNLDL